MKYTLLLTTLSLSLSVRAMQEKKAQESTLWQELEKLTSTLNELERREDASPAMIQEVQDQITQKNAEIDTITKHKESLE